MERPVAAHPQASMRLELWGASRKSALLAELIGVPVQVVSPTGEVVHFDDDSETDTD